MPSRDEILEMVRKQLGLETAMFPRDLNIEGFNYNLCVPHPGFTEKDMSQCMGPVSPDVSQMRIVAPHKGKLRLPNA